MEKTAKDLFNCRSTKKLIHQSLPIATSVLVLATVESKIAPFVYISLQFKPLVVDFFCNRLNFIFPRSLL